MQRSKLKVVIDPGHGGDVRVGGSAANNAVGPNGLLEKDLTLDIARRVAALLSDRATVTLTRTRDENLSLADRARVARDANADVFLSIHLNGWRDPAVDGSEAWVATKSGVGSRALAHAVLDRVVGITHAHDRGVRAEDFGVLLPERVGPNTAASLIEVAFLTNADEADRLSHNEYRQQLAQAIADGISERLNAGAAVATALQATGPARLDGIDCDSRNHIPGWDEMRADGIRFAIFKESEGRGWYDDGTLKDSVPHGSFFERREAALANRMLVGAYHFGRAVEPLASANDHYSAQATTMVKGLRRLVPGELPPTFDFEERGQIADVAWRGAQWLGPLETFLDVVEFGLGRVPMIYTSARIWRDEPYIRDDPAFARFADYPLWIVDYMAHPPVAAAQRYSNRLTRDPILPATWSDWTLWQYSGDFTPSGATETPNLNRVDHKLDMNVSNGGIHVLRGLADLGRPAPHGDAVRFVAYTEEDGTIKALTYLGYWLDANLTEMAKDPNAATGPLAAGDVAACEIGGHQFYAFRGRDDAHLYELERNASEFTLTDLSVTIAGTDGRVPTLVADPVYLVDGTDRAIAYWGSDDSHHVLRHVGGAWKRPSNETPTGATGSATMFASDGYVFAVGRTGWDGGFAEIIVDDGGTVSRSRGVPGADYPTRATYQPASYVLADGSIHIVYRAVRGAIHKIVRAEDGRDDDLSQLSGGAPTCAGNPAVLVLGGVPHIVYRRPDGHLHEIAGNGSGGWTHGPLPCDDRAAADPGAYTATDAGQQAGFVVFRNRDGNFVEAKLTSAGWTCAPIQPAENPPPAEQLGWAASTPVAGALATSDQDDPISTADSTLVDHVTPATCCGVRSAPGLKGFCIGGSYMERAPEKVVIHVIDGNGYTSAIKAWHDGTSCVFPHYAVKDDGEITQVVAEKFMAQHAGTANATAIGVEHDGNDNDPASFTEAMYVKSAALIRDICARNHIDVDRTHIIGHDEVRGTDHGDPGGYWDWDYYIALARWDGTTAASRPYRQVVETDDLPATAVGPSWQRTDRDSGNATWTSQRRRKGPLYFSGYGAHHLWADAAPDAPLTDSVVYTYTVPVAGDWGVSAWWPIVPGANAAAQIEITTTRPSDTQPDNTWSVDQTSLAQPNTRRTVALELTPVWHLVGGGYVLEAGDTITVRIHRRSPQAGKVIADAVRFLLIPSQP